MKNLLALFMLLAFVTVCMGCAARTPEEKAAIARAESVNFTGAGSSNQVVIISDPSVIVPHDNLSITKVDGTPVKNSGIPRKNIAFTAPGKHTLTVVIDTGLTAGSSMVGASGGASVGISMSSRVALPPVDSEHTFEKGKYYKLDYDMGWSKTEFTFTEITSAEEMAKVNGYI